MYDPALVEPMRRELTDVGVEELRTMGEVDAILKDQKGTALVVVNSVCGCPDKITTVFAGQDLEATNHARSYFKGYFPTSPQIALMKDGEVAFMLERYDIEGRTAQDVAQRLVTAFDEHCG
jgi:hypothetical protein